MKDISFYLTDKAIEHIERQASAHSHHIGRPISESILSVIIPPDKDVALLGFIPDDVLVPDECHSLGDIKIFFDHCEDIEHKLNGRYVDEINDMLLIRGRGPGVKIRVVCFKSITAPR